MAQYIDKDSLVAEIERRIKEVSQIEKASYEIGLFDAYKIVLSFINTLEVEEVQEESVDKCKGCNNVKGCITCVDGDQWAHYEEPISKELEEASKEWLRPQLDKSYAAYGETKQMELTHFDGYAMLDAIEFGAKWKEQQMMTKAIVREVKVDAGGYPYIDTTELYDYDKDMPLAKEGDKVKVIILNDE